MITLWCHASTPRQVTRSLIATQSLTKELFNGLNKHNQVTENLDPRCLQSYSQAVRLAGASLLRGEAAGGKETERTRSEAAFEQLVKLPGSEM